MSHQEGIAITIDGQRPDSSAAPLRAARESVRSLYIHVPFCAHKCHYCDFYSFVDRGDRRGEFVDAVILELTAMAALIRGGLDTVFVGGGTPSLLDPDLWARLLEALRRLVPGFPSADLEFTVECNPESVTPELLRTLAAGGVNRISMGAQSFDRDHLRTLERIHDPENVGRALGMVRDAGIARRNIDLIFAIPGQSHEDWARDLAIACDLARRGMVDHLSGYALTYEPNTAMTKRMQMGEFRPAGDDTESTMYETMVAAMRASGLQRYEVSNFSRPGSECRHNLAYWRCQEWLAAGPSASAHVAGHRWKNVPKLSEWMEGVTESGGYAPVVDLERPDPARALKERLMMGLRTTEGLPLREILDAADSIGMTRSLERELHRVRDRGQIETIGDNIRVRDDAFLWCDGIAARLMGAIDAEG